MEVEIWRLAATTHRSAHNIPHRQWVGCKAETLAMPAFKDYLFSIKPALMVDAAPCHLRIRLIHTRHTILITQTLPMTRMVPTTHTTPTIHRSMIPTGITEMDRPGNIRTTGAGTAPFRSLRSTASVPAASGQIFDAAPQVILTWALCHYPTAKVKDNAPYRRLA